MPHMAVFSSLRRRSRSTRPAAAPCNPARDVRDRTHWVGFVGQLPAALCAAHDDCACRGSPAEYFEIPYLVTHASLPEAWAWRYRLSGLLKTVSLRDVYCGRRPSSAVCYATRMLSTLS